MHCVHTARLGNDGLTIQLCRNAVRVESGLCATIHWGIYRSFNDWAAFQISSAGSWRPALDSCKLNHSATLFIKKLETRTFLAYYTYEDWHKDLVQITKCNEWNLWTDLTYIRYGRSYSNSERLSSYWSRASSPNCWIKFNRCSCKNMQKHEKRDISKLISINCNVWDA